MAEVPSNPRHSEAHVLELFIAGRRDIVPAGDCSQAGGQGQGEAVWAGGSFLDTASLMSPGQHCREGCSHSATLPPKEGTGHRGQGEGEAGGREHWMNAERYR